MRVECEQNGVLSVSQLANVVEKPRSLPNSHK